MKKIILVRRDMKSYHKGYFYGMVLGITGILLFCNSAVAEETVTTAAVLDLETREGISQGVVSTISDYLRTQLVNTNKFIIVTRENMEQILKEQKFQMSGCTSQECIVQVGQLLGVRKMFTGSIGKVGTTYVVNLKIIDVQTGKIEKAEAEMAYTEDQLLPATQNLARKMAGLLTQSLARAEVAPQPPAKAGVVPQPSVKTVPAGWLGVCINNVTDKFAKSFSLTSKEGALVIGVYKNSPAEKAQIKRGDVIIGCNGKKVKDIAELVSITRKTLTGEKIPVEILRSGKEITVESVMEEALPNESLFNEKFGLTVLNTKDGVLITGIKEGTFAGNAEIDVGDLIKKINDKEINYISDFDEEIKKVDSAQLLVEKGNAATYVTVSKIEKFGIGVSWVLPAMQNGDFIPAFTLCNYTPNDPGNNVGFSFKIWKSSNTLTSIDFDLGYPFVFIKPIKTFTLFLFLGGCCNVTWGDIPGGSNFYNIMGGFRGKGGIEFFAGPVGIFFESGINVIMGGLAGYEDTSGEEHEVGSWFIGVDYPLNSGVRFYF